MRLLSVTFNLLAFVSCVICAVVEGRAATCNSKNVAYVNRSSKHAIFFCDFYLSYPRTNSPFQLLGASDTWAACKCITASARTPRRYNTMFAPKAGSSCSVYTKVLSNEYPSPSAFCSFYMYQDRTRSTIPGISVNDLKKACKCLSGTSTTSQVVTRTTTMTSRTSIASTKTSTCSNNALTTAAGNFVSGLASWTKTANPASYASVATGASFDSSGSAAILACKYASTADSHGSICSPRLPICPGQTYQVSFKYKFPSSGSIGGSLSLYNYGWDEMLLTRAGPASAGAKDGAGTPAATWGTMSQTFEATQQDDMICITLQCLTGNGLTGKTAQVTVDNVRVSRVT
ncbi:hypothetical protein AAFC00_002364 [Neodothiora populina]|uniref:CBM-cenC domain-containing protein n=1 Tax=Neodothiora populina TaxID=2781224 RepID=A0ABR3PH67_9PEZI